MVHFNGSRFQTSVQDTYQLGRFHVYQKRAGVNMCLEHGRLSWSSQLTTNLIQITSIQSGNQQQPGLLAVTPKLHIMLAHKCPSAQQCTCCATQKVFSATTLPQCALRCTLRPLFCPSHEIHAADMSGFWQNFPCWGSSPTSCLENYSMPVDHVDPCEGHEIMNAKDISIWKIILTKMPLKSTIM